MKCLYCGGDTKGMAHCINIMCLAHMRPLGSNPNPEPWPTEEEKMDANTAVAAPHPEDRKTCQNNGGAEPMFITGKDAGLTNSDPWKHRSSKMHCSACMWFCPKVKEDNTESDLGRCRKNAPSMNGFVPVYVTDWCGQHRLDENRT